MYFDTVASDTRMPSLSSSPWIRGAPHRLTVAMRLMRERISGSMPGRPPLSRLRQAQYRRNPARCHLMTVAGLTMISASFQRAQVRESSTQRPRSTLVNRGRLTDRWRTPSWWRRARISTASWRRVLKKARPAWASDRTMFNTAPDRGSVLDRSQRFHEDPVSRRHSGECATTVLCFGSGTRGTDSRSTVAGAAVVVDFHPKGCAMRAVMLSLGLVVVATTACAPESEDGGSTDGGVAGNGAAGGPTTAGTGGSAGDLPGRYQDCPTLSPASGPTVAVTAAQAGDLVSIVYDTAAGTTVLLEPGTYALTAGLQLHVDGVTLRSSTNRAEDVTIDGAYAVDELIAISASHVTVAHVTLARGVNHLVHLYPPAAGVDVTGTRLYGLRLIDGGEQFVKVNPVVGQAGYVDDGRVECSLFRMTDAGRPHVEPNPGGCYTGGIDAHAAWNWVVRANRFEGIYCTNGGLAEHAIHFWVGSRGTLVENNVIIDCARGVGFGLGDRVGDRAYPDAPYGGQMLGHYDGVIRNNVIWANLPHFDTGIELHMTRAPRIIHNTVLAGPADTAFFRSIDYRYSVTEVVLANNLVTSQGPRDGATATLVTNLEHTPLSDFVDTATYDFHLTASATDAIDQGTVEPDSGIDIDGQPHRRRSGPRRRRTLAGTPRDLRLRHQLLCEDGGACYAACQP